MKKTRFTDGADGHDPPAVDESKHVSALRAYLRRAVENRVQDELRLAMRCLDVARLGPREAPLRPLEDAAPQYISNASRMSCGGVDVPPELSSTSV